MVEENLSQKPPIIIFGGINPSFLPETYLRVGDIVIQGEGEHLLLKVLDENITEGILGWGELKKEEWKHLTFRLPYHLAPWEKIWEFNRVNFGVSEAIRFVTVSGCRRGCVFCSSTNFVRKIRWLDAYQLRILCDWAGEILPKSGIIILQGDDELYGKARKRFFELYEEGYRFPRPVSLQTEAKRINEDVALVLKELGVFEVCLGIESFSDNILKEYNKKAKAEDNERALRILLEAGIEPYANMILRGIESSEEDINFTKRKIEYWKKRGVKFGVNEEILVLSGTAKAE